MEIWKTPKAAFPTFPQGLLPETKTETQNNKGKGTRPRGREYQFMPLRASSNNDQSVKYGPGPFCKGSTRPFAVASSQ